MIGMADNIAEMTSISEEQASASSRWAFLKKVASAGKARLAKIAHRSPARTTTPAIVEVNSPQLEPQITEDSGLGQLVKTMEQTGHEVSAERIKLLYPDFIKYLNEYLKNKFMDDTQTLERIDSELNNGNREVIEMFARSLVKKYSQEVKQNQKKVVNGEKVTKPRNHAERRQESRAESKEAYSSPGYKMSLADVLAYEMKQQISLEEHRESRAEVASQHGEWKAVLAPQQSSSNFEKLGKELEGVGLDPGLPKTIQPPSLQKLNL